MQGFPAEFDGEERCPCGADCGRVGDSDGIENRGQRRQFIEPAMIAFKIIPLQDYRHVTQCVLMPGHAARAGLPQFREERRAHVQPSLDG